MNAPSLTPPRFARSPRTSHHVEKWSWILMRVSGAILIVLIFTHLFVNLMTGDGINAIDFAFVAGKWAQPLWQWWDAAMLWLGMFHGTNGMRVLVNDYARTETSRSVLKALLALAFIVTVVLGTLVIFTFDPCPIGANPDLLPSFCESVS